MQQQREPSRRLRDLSLRTDLHGCGRSNRMSRQLISRCSCCGVLAALPACCLQPGWCQQALLLHMLVPVLTLAAVFGCALQLTKARQAAQAAVDAESEWAMQRAAGI